MFRGNHEPDVYEADKSEPIHISKQHFEMKASCRGVSVSNRTNVEEYCCRISQELIYVAFLGLVIATRNGLCDSLEWYRDLFRAGVPSALTRRSHCLRFRCHGMNMLDIHRKLQ